MKKKNQLTSFKRLQNRYKLVVSNDDTYEEIITFRLSRVSVYVAMSTTFILMIGFTIALISFTPLKYYIPGYGSKKNMQELQLLKIKTDSLTQAINYKDKYLQNIKQVLEGSNSIVLDTIPITID